MTSSLEKYLIEKTARIYGRGLDVDDARQEAAIAYWKATLSGSFDPSKGSFSTFVTTVIRRALRDARWQDQLVRYPAKKRGLKATICEFEDESDAEFETAALDVRSLLRQIDLSDRESQILYRMYWLGDSQAEIARDLGVSKVRVGEIVKKVYGKLKAVSGMRESSLPNNEEVDEANEACRSSA